ncbi:uncharacterized protein T069G_11290 [Trichoderma breve]|uniref:Lysine-specific metallo-endopeptidase domain-containing protein n=1 Tax=Trichoderma breve TaxID=2034170 RepID=A0A9W9B6P6_9HYPO|nr:uncharacterized protein T069G_11290 [Trichoderma breve]KAJ4854311.1 hypothetical protein T069G_11290 [Trichoderma breve]
MRWSILSSLFWLLVASSAHYLEDDNYDPFNKTLWRRVRGPGGDGGGQQPTASELFLIGDSSLPASCASRVDVLDEWVNEANLLHEAAMTVYSGYKTKNAYAILMNQFFGFAITINRNPNGPNTYSLTPRNGVPQRYTTIGDRLARVSQFLAGAGLRDPPVPGEAPRVLCSGDAHQLVGPGDITRDKNGNRVVTARDPTTNEPTEYLSIQDAFKYEEEANFFWVSAFNGYAQLKKLSAGETEACPKDNIRYAATNRGGTLSKIIEPSFEFGKCNRMILFCPASFDVKQWVAGEPGNAHNFPSLAQAVTIDNYPSATAGKGGTKTLDDLGLDNILPRSATLYHELIHLTDNYDTKDPYYQLSDILRTAKKEDTKSELIKNPESFVFFAMAAYMTINAPEGASPVTYMGGLPMRVSEIPF